MLAGGELQDEQITHLSGAKCQGGGGGGGGGGKGWKGWVDGGGGEGGVGFGFAREGGRGVSKLEDMLWLCVACCLFFFFFLVICQRSW